MNTYPYLWLALFVLALTGMSLALHQDMKPSTRPTNLRWAKWTVVMAILAIADTLMLAQPWA